MHVIIYEENRWSETASRFMFNTAVATEDTQNNDIYRAG